jgi:YjbE family integral membrane protein
MHDALAVLLAALGIAFVNLALSGDNGVMIAGAVAKLPRAVRLRAIAAGSFTTVVIQVTITYLAAQLLHLALVQVLGGLLLLWIGVNLPQASAASLKLEPSARNFWSAVWLLVTADLSISTDNVLAVAAMAKDQIVPLVLGLGFSIPAVIVASGAISRIMDRFPFLIWVAAAIIGRSAANLIVTDDVIAHAIRPSPLFVYCMQAVGATAVVVAGKLLEQRASAHRKPGNVPGEPV